MRNRKLFQRTTKEGQDLILKLEVDSLYESDFLWKMLEKDKAIREDSLFVDRIARRITEEELENYQSIRKEHERIRLALLVGFSGEIERNSLEENFRTPIRIDTISSGTFLRQDTTFRSEKLRKTLPTEFLWRLVIRPTATWQSDKFKLDWRAYVKLPLLFWNRANRSVEEDKPLDFTENPINEIQRGYDWRLENTISLSVGSGPVETTLSYTYYYDNFPARAYLSPREPSPFFRNVHLFEAEKHHHIVRLRVSYGI